MDNLGVLLVVWVSGGSGVTWVEWVRKLLASRHMLACRRMVIDFEIGTHTDTSKWETSG
jgi:hypothetical protein